MDRPTPHPEEGQLKELHLPQPKRYLNEDEVCELLRCTKRSLRQRPDSAKPPCIRMSKRRKLWDPIEVEAWLANIPRTK